MQRYLLGGIGLVALAAALPAGAYTIDGNVAEWGALVLDNNQSMFTLPAQTGLLGYFQEDSDDFANDWGYLGPYDGGQNYDAELMAVAADGGNLFVAIVSGQRPDNGFARFSPGDLRIETSAGTYWLEIGGGAGASSGLALLDGTAGSTYTLNSIGFTIAHAATDPAQTVGSIWSNVNAILDPIGNNEPTQFAIHPGSTHIGDADYVYTRNAASSEHSVIEISIPIGLFAGATIESMHWRPSCDNDEVDVALNYVPEPATVALLALGASSALRRSKANARDR